MLVVKTAIEWFIQFYFELGLKYKDIGTDLTSLEGI